MTKAKNILLILTIFIFAISTATGAYMPGRTYRRNNQLQRIIGPGDTLYSLARTYDTTIEQLQNLNPNISPEYLQVGNTIKLSLADNLKYHILNPGESLWEIARQYDVNLQELIAYNNIYAPEQVMAGEIIVIPVEREQQVRAVLYFLRYTQQDAFLVPEVRQVSFTENLYRAVIEDLISGPEIKTDSYMPIPEETQVLSVTLDNGLATINFSEDIKRTNVGAEGEALLIQAITNTLTEYAAVQEVRILINGYPDSIGGHIGLDRTFNRNLEVVQY